MSRNCAHRLKQAQDLLRLGVRQAADTFICTREDGLPLQPNTLTINWDRLIAKTALPRIRFHDLQHAHATHLLSSGIHPKVASERLGHSKLGVTLDLYSPSCRECRRTLPPRSMRPCERPTAKPRPRLDSLIGGGGLLPPFSFELTHGSP